MHAFVLLLRLGFAGPSLNYGLNEFQPWLPLTSSCALISVKVVIFTFGFVFFLFVWTPLYSDLFLFDV